MVDIPEKIWMCIVWYQDKPIRAFNTIDQAYNWATKKFCDYGEQIQNIEDIKFTWSLLSENNLVKPK